MPPEMWETSLWDSTCTDCRVIEFAWQLVIWEVGHRMIQVQWQLPHRQRRLRPIFRWCQRPTLAQQVKPTQFVFWNKHHGVPLHPKSLG